MKYRFIDNHRFMFPVVKMCQTFKIAKSGFYYWLENRNNKKIKDQNLLLKIKAISQKSKQIYGRPRLTKALNKNKFEANEKRVHRIMKEHNIFAKTKKKFRICCTDSKHEFPISPNLVKQNFTVNKPNELWFADISYIPTRSGWMYLAAILDACTRKIVGWSMDKLQTTNLVKTALLSALSRQKIQNGLVLHSDRGKQYASREYRNLCKEQGFLQSMSRTANPYDNAMMESFFHTLKTEQTHWDNYKTIEEAKQKVFEYIEIFYNRQRLHSGIGYKSPIEFEKEYFSA